MEISIKKIIVRLSVALVMSTILAYIFWPQSETIEIAIELNTTTTTLAIIPDPPCLVFFEKDKDVTVFQETACVSTYVEKYKANYYNTINVVCRSSSDGQNVNRENLSEKRMKSLQFYLLEQGIPYENIKALSVGDKVPYSGVDPESEDGKMVNRSCELTALIK